MKRIYLYTTLLLLTITASAQKSIIKLDKETLMHEVRATPSPLNGQHIDVNPPRFMWPDKFPHLGAVLDGVEGHEHKPKVTYRIRISRDPQFKVDVMEAERNWAFYNPFRLLEQGKWYWQHAYVNDKGKEEWSPVYHFFIDKDTKQLNPPSFEQLAGKLPAHHPRILLDSREWEEIRNRNHNNPEALGYIQRSDDCMSHPLHHLSEEIDTTNLGVLTNEVQYKAALIRESRKIVDREEKNIEAMVRAYLLTKDTKYYSEAMRRLTEIISWKDSKYFAGDFNLSTILSMSTSAYDAFYNILKPNEKALLLQTIKENGTVFFDEYVNHLENRIADNHVWQMTFRILNMAAFVTLGELPEAETWADYCYNFWVSRLPGLNSDGAWHNGDSYFHVNIRTLIEVPAFYSRISGFDFFSDPWYNKNALYVIYHQPPFSKSAGHGNSHETKKKPNGARVGYADALARECNNPWAEAYVRDILAKEPAILSSAFEGKSGDLTWYRCTTRKPFPHNHKSLAELPAAKIFNETGVATMHTSLAEPDKNAMLSFRSSPYGATSHALSNQNAFNTFYGGNPVFYSSGHRTGFTDDHCMYSYRNTRAHNTILADGMVQKIGTEGYGWIPRFYEGEQLSYLVGDASNAYGKVTSALWLERARLSGTQFTPDNGWDDNKVNFFRRHIVQLGKSGIYVIYDELEAKEPIAWSYLLHTTEYPMKVEQQPGKLIVQGRNTTGTSTAHIFCSAQTTPAVTDQFFCSPVNWKNVTDGKGKSVKYPNHWHFSATTEKCTVVRFLTVVDTHGPDREDMEVTSKNETVIVNGWKIRCNLTAEGLPFIRIENTAEKVSLVYDMNKNEGATLINDRIQGKQVKKELRDVLPEVEI